MSSRQQFKEALKGDKKIIADLKKEIELKDASIKRMIIENRSLKIVNEDLVNKLCKKWWQIWK
jgi:regulator of replication initiation timing